MIITNAHHEDKGCEAAKPHGCRYQIARLTGCLKNMLRLIQACESNNRTQESLSPNALHKMSNGESRIIRLIRNILNNYRKSISMHMDFDPKSMGSKLIFVSTIESLHGVKRWRPSNHKDLYDCKQLGDRRDKILVQSQRCKVVRLPCQ